MDVMKIIDRRLYDPITNQLKRALESGRGAAAALAEARRTKLTKHHPELAGLVEDVRFDCARCCDPDARPGGADAPPERAKPDWRRRKNAAFWNPQAPLAGAREAELLINPP